MSKFTEGPWFIDNYQIKANGDAVLFSFVTFGGRQTDESVANARLISKAPEMYELLIAYINLSMPKKELDSKISYLINQIAGDADCEEHN